MAPAQEIEVKLRVSNLEEFTMKVQHAGFRLVTPRTHESNTLYDFPDRRLRGRGQLIRIRKYGEKWTLTHKSRGSSDKHKSRAETETQVTDGEALAHVLTSIGMEPSFRYEKYRAEWTDGVGHILIDETPIGNIVELEGPPEWIDRTAAKLGIKESEYITQSYAEMFADWCRRTRSAAKEMTWQQCEGVNS
jgi:adenylate cyclase class 2